MNLEDLLQLDAPSVWAEEALLGAMLLSSEAVSLAMQVVRAEHFTEAIYSDIFGAMEQLFLDSKPVDPMTVAEQMGADQPEKATLVALQASAPALSNARFFASMVAMSAVLRFISER